MTLFAAITGTGSFLPAQIWSNDAIAAGLETSDAWIRNRTGIAQRHVASPDEDPSNFAVCAAQAALVMAGVAAAEVDAIIVATSTAQECFPAMACRVQAALGARAGGMAVDVNAACSGFVYALALGDAWLKAHRLQHILIIGCECMTRAVDWQDRSTAILFGDGSGAVLLSAAAQPGIVDTYLGADGRGGDQLRWGIDPSARQLGYLTMQGREVAKHAVTEMAHSGRVLLERHQLSAEDIHWLIPHQANLRLIEMIGQRLGFPCERVVRTVGQHANTSAASIPLALDQAVRAAQVQTDQRLLFLSFGAGFTWGSALIKWTAPTASIDALS